LLRLGFLTVYLSEPFISGFTSAAAFQAFTSQLPLVFGLTNLRRIQGPFKLPKFYGRLIPLLYWNINWMTTAVALISIVALYIAKDLNDRYKSSIGFVLPNELLLVSDDILSPRSIYSLV
jgi:MFS superfamily sulfate permease-like transporter